MAWHLARSLVAKTRGFVGHHPKLICSFCGSDETKVSRLVAGGSAHICDSCIAECVAVLENHGGFDRPAPTQSNWANTPSDR
jgi:ClpX C4-type zinc finger